MSAASNANGDNTDPRIKMLWPKQRAVHMIYDADVAREASAKLFENMSRRTSRTSNQVEAPGSHSNM